MGLAHNFFLDTLASCHELRDRLVEAGVGFETRPDWKHTSGAATEATIVTIVTEDPSTHSWRPDNDVWATRRVNFGDRKIYLSKPETYGLFDIESVRGVMALLKAYPDADAYWEAYDAALPVLLRRGGRLVLSQALTENNEFWDPARQPLRALVDLPYTVELLGPWKNGAGKAREAGTLSRTTDRS